MDKFVDLYTKHEKCVGDLKEETILRDTWNYGFECPLIVVSSKQFILSDFFIFYYNVKNRILQTTRTRTLTTLALEICDLRGKKRVETLQVYKPISLTQILHPPPGTVGGQGQLQQLTFRQCIQISDKKIDFPKGKCQEVALAWKWG